MRIINVSIGAKEYVSATFDAPADDISTDTLQIAVTVNAPTSADWANAVGVTRVDDHHVTGSILLDADGYLPGPYTVWTRIDDGTENVPRRAGVVIIR